MIRPTLIDLNPVELNYYPFRFSLDKCSGSYNFIDDLSTKLCVPSKTKDICVKVFNIITNKSEAKTMVKHTPSDCKCKFNSTTCNLNQKWSNNDAFQCEYKKYHKCKKDYSWNSYTCICENGKYLKSIADTSVIPCDEIKYVMDIVSTNVAKTIPINVTNTVPTNFHKKPRYKMDCYILHTVLLVIILLFTIGITCYHHEKRKSKLKKILAW